ncbi:DUF6436 domain-containing protein [Andreprevotia chitinilytica]|uniref:DUF6436 domain-containing protein n=1 Tax=Andreprevotia chitinilytica TaxID=396808 RepID=UPI0012EC6D2B|nr:DUF6436 domain-containing protein [Andreprevotia chitinilytica]
MNTLSTTTTNNVAATLAKVRPWHWLMVVVWLLGTAWALWWFQGRNLRPFSLMSGQTAHVVPFTRPDITLPPSFTQQIGANHAPAKALLVHFWNPDCPCARFSDLHVKALLAAFGPQGVTLLVVPKPGVTASAQLADKVRATFGRSAILIEPAQWPTALTVPVSPATAVFDGSGHLAYLGPYSLDSFCSTTDNGPAERVLQGILAGSPVKLDSVAAVGCFCPWSDQPGDQSA